MHWFSRRKYPIKRDPSGRSARQRAFALFTEGKRPAQVCKMLPMSFRTACRYFQDYRQLNHLISYPAMRRWMREHPEFSERVIDVLAKNLQIPLEQVMARVGRPWGLLELMKGRWTSSEVKEHRTQMEERLEAALLIIQFADKFGGNSPHRVKQLFTRLMSEHIDEPANESGEW